MAQTLRDIEIIVIDDASSDGTVAVVERYACRDTRIRLIKNETNLGPSGARNRGIAAATGDWLAVLDADDAYRADRLECLVALGERDAADMVADNLYLFDAVAREVSGLALPSLDPLRTHHVETGAFLAQCVTGRSQFDYGQLKAVLRRDFLLRHRLSYPDHLRHGEDFILYAKIMLNGGKFVLSGRPGYYFTQRHGGISRQPSLLSRTKTDFDGMRRSTLELLQHPSVTPGSPVAELLLRRSTAILWHKTTFDVANHVRSRDVIGLLKATGRDWRVGAVLGRKVFQRLSTRRTV